MSSNAESAAPVPGVVRAEEIRGDEEEDTAALREMLEQARNYLQSFSWSGSIVDSYFAGGVGKVFAIFLFKIDSAWNDIEPWHWIFVGDVPPAYLSVSDAPSKTEAFEAYVEGMKRWVEVARQGREPGDEDCCPPVNVPATPKWAELLDRRLAFLSEVIRPFFE